MAERRRSAFGPQTYDRKFEIVSGKTFSSNQTYFTSARSPDAWTPPLPPPQRVKPKKCSSSKSWGFSDPEMKRRKRVAGYKAYAVEGKVKASVRKSFRWIKDKFSNIVHGW